MNKHLFPIINEAIKQVSNFSDNHNNAKRRIKGCVSQLNNFKTTLCHVDKPFTEKEVKERCEQILHQNLTVHNGGFGGFVGPSYEKYSIALDRAF